MSSFPLPPCFETKPRVEENAAIFFHQNNVTSFFKQNAVTVLFNKYRYLLRPTPRSTCIPNYLLVRPKAPKKTPHPKLGRIPSPIRKKTRTRWGSPPDKWFSVGCSSPFMRLAEHLTALRAWRMPIKLRRAPSRSIAGVPGSAAFKDHGYA